MPNYPTHARWGRVGGGVMALAVGVALFGFLGSPVLAGIGAVGAGVATFVGAIFPDIDHDDSIPRRRAVAGLRALVAVGIAAMTGLQFDRLVSAVDAAGLSAGGSPPPGAVVVGGAAVATLLLTWAVDPVIGVVTRKHRGWTHSVPVTFALTGAVVAVVWVLTGSLGGSGRLTAAVVTGTFFPGVLVHLGLDGELT